MAPRGTRWRLAFNHRTGRRGTDAVDQLGAGDEWHTKASHSQQDTAAPRIILYVMRPALDRAESDGIGDEKRLEARLDGEQSANLLERHMFSKRHANGAVPPFPD
jgi:hypothetical protein